MSIHPAAAQGYQVSSDAYERGRHEAPRQGVQYLILAIALRAGIKVLDLGAGTGKLTKVLESVGARIFAVEPVEAMRRKLAENAPHATVLEGTAEAIPLGAESVHAV